MAQADHSVQGVSQNVMIDNNIDDGASTTASSESLTSKREKARKLASRAKRKTQPIFKISTTSDSENDNNEEAQHVFDDPAFNPAIVLDGSPGRSRKDESTTKEKLKAAGTAIAHPRRTIRDKVTHTAAGKMSTVQRPFLTGDHDRDLLDAHDDLSRAISSQSSCDEDSEARNEAEAKARERIVKVEEHRDCAKTAWAIGRHVQRVRVVQGMPRRPRKDEFVDKDSSGGETKFRWPEWLGQLALYYTQGFTAQYWDDFEDLAFDIEDFSRIVERISMASAPWQSWLIAVRKVYIWEDARLTGKWCALFWVLWYTEHIMGFVYFYIIYATLRNRYYPDKVGSIRKAYQRSVDQAAKAEAWGELVEKHGKRDWVEPLMDQCGPLVQLQLADLADYIEAVANFYHWEVPSKTAASIFFFSVCLLITLTADVAFCMKVVWFIVGTSFFLTYPIATRFPKYRRLVSAWRWFIWDIPTDSEWAIRTLQCKMLVRQAEMLEDAQADASWKHDTDSDSVSDYNTAEESASKISFGIPRERFRFRVYQGSTLGHLIIDRKSLRFTTWSSSWRIPFSHLVEMRKSSARKVVKAKALKASLVSIDFVHLDEDGLEQTHVCSMPENVSQEVFSLALGLSGLRWRVLQVERHNKADGKGTSHLDSVVKERT